MHQKRRRSIAILLLFPLAACGPSPDPVEDEQEGAPVAASQYTYFREYIFVGSDADDLLVVPFSFHARETATDGFVRGARAWLARDETWDRFLDQSREASGAGGVWRIVPIDDLRLDAGGPAEIDAIRFEQGERRLRLDLAAPMGGWNQGGESRFRLVESALSVGAEQIGGTVLEVLRVERTLADGWPPGRDYDAIFLTSGDSLFLYLGETIGQEQEQGAEAGFAWLRRDGREHAWASGEIEWTDFRPLEEARRDVPNSWSIRIPAGEITGEVVAAGSDVMLGPERAGRRAVEIRYTVEGFLAVEGVQIPVQGMIRHTQR